MQLFSTESIQLSQYIQIEIEICIHIHKLTPKLEGFSEFASLTVDHITTLLIYNNNI